MPDSICLADCLYQDDQGRIAVSIDNSTITCQPNGAGGTHLVATSNYANLPQWPFACDPSIYGLILMFRDRLRPRPVGR